MNYGQKVLKYKERIVFEKLTIPYFDRIPKEFFEIEACFIFVNKGEFSVRSPTNYLDFEPGQGLLAKCLNYFFETNANQRQVGEGVEVIGVLLYPSMVEELFDFELSAYSYTVDFNLKQVQIDALLNNFRDSVNLLLDHPELADEAMIKTKLREFVLLISKSQGAPSHYDFLAAMFKPDFAAFRNVIQSNLFSSCSLDELAALCHMSLSTFKRRFKEAFKETPKKYIAEKKVHKAAEMLKSNNYRIAEIAYECGFETLSSFNRTFKTSFGVSPSDYRVSLNA
ncbi:MAG: AraC family transcriptional regulator [Imperialibacter sp.]|uniref:helix-turn-helix domain-containing protein n=1 Tax=Imperialibacter sp. TaxID=2038411 RepID=UPI0032EB942F